MWFFDTREMQCLPPQQVTPFGTGLAAGLHATCRRSVKSFRRALFEAHEYLRVGFWLCPQKAIKQCM